MSQVPEPAHFKEDFSAVPSLARLALLWVVQLVRLLISPPLSSARLPLLMVSPPYLQATTHRLTVSVEPKDYLLSLLPHLSLAHMPDDPFLHEARDVTLRRKNAHRLMRLAERQAVTLVALLIQERKTATSFLIISRQINSTLITTLSGYILIAGVAVNDRVVK